MSVASSNDTVADVGTAGHYERDCDPGRALGRVQLGCEVPELLPDLLPNFVPELVPARNGGKSSSSARMKSTTPANLDPRGSHQGRHRPPCGRSVPTGLHGPVISVLGSPLSRGGLGEAAGTMAASRGHRDDRLVGAR